MLCENSELKKTIFNDIHRAIGGRMVCFGNWDLPVHYGSQIEEHHAVRRDAGMFDVSHMCPIELTGNDVRAFLSQLLANDVAKLKEHGKALYSCLLNEAGGVIDDLIVYYLDENRFRLVVNATTAESDIAWMQQCVTKWQMAVLITPLREGSNYQNSANAQAMIALQGPNALAKLSMVIPESAYAQYAQLRVFYATEISDQKYGKLFIARTGYTGEDGFEIMLAPTQAIALWQDLQAVGVTPCGLGARDTLRQEAGMPLYGNEMDASTSPLDAGLAWSIAMGDARNFVGKSALLANGASAKFVGLKLLERGVLRAHQIVQCQAGDGLITSGTFSPSLECAIALARLPLGVKIGEQVCVLIRDKKVTAQIVKPNFVRNGKAI